ncbi:MAG: hypothetical protein QW728_00780 [Thermoplasmata archaeon]
MDEKKRIAAIVLFIIISFFLGVVLIYYLVQDTSGSILIYERKYELTVESNNSHILSQPLLLSCPAIITPEGEHNFEYTLVEGQASFRIASINITSGEDIENGTPVLEINTTSTCTIKHSYYIENATRSKEMSTCLLSTLSGEPRHGTGSVSFYSSLPGVRVYLNYSYSLISLERNGAFIIEGRRILAQGNITAEGFFRLRAEEW